MNSTTPGVNNVKMIEHHAVAALDSLTRTSARGVTHEVAMAMVQDARTALARIVELLEGIEL